MGRVDGGACTPAPAAGRPRLVTFLPPLTTRPPVLAPLALQAAATAAGVAPSQLLSDFSLWEIVNKRPGELAGLASCSGCSEHFIRSHGAAFVRAVVHFCGSSELLSVRDTEAAPAPGSQAGGSQSQRRHSVPAAGGMCSQAAACLSEPKVGVVYVPAQGCLC